MTGLVFEQLHLKSPEYEQAVDDLSTTANALLFLHRQVGDSSNFMYANFNSSKLPYGHISLNKPLPQPGESLAEWYKKLPSIRRFKLVTADVAAIADEDSLIEEDGILLKVEAYSDCGNYHAVKHEMTLEEIHELQHELEGSEPLAPKARIESRNSAALSARRVLRRLVRSVLHRP